MVDMPFMSYQISVEQAMQNAGRIMKETGASAVKLEGGKEVCPQIRAITAAGIPVVAHIGMTPQSVNDLPCRARARQTHAACSRMRSRYRRQALSR